MKRYIIVLGFVFLPFAASAEPYAPTLSAEEQERHEFIDAQANNYPSGRAESGMTSPRPQASAAKGSTDRTISSVIGAQQ